MISLGIFGIDNAVMAIVALLTGAALVALALWLAGLISPRSFNPQKGEAYECGLNDTFPCRLLSFCHPLFDV